MVYRFICVSYTASYVGEITQHLATGLHLRLHIYKYLKNSEECREKAGSIGLKLSIVLPYMGIDLRITMDGKNQL